MGQVPREVHYILSRQHEFIVVPVPYFVVSVPEPFESLGQAGTLATAAGRALGRAILRKLHGKAGGRGRGTAASRTRVEYVGPTASPGEGQRATGTPTPRAAGVRSPGCRADWQVAGRKAGRWDGALAVQRLSQRLLGEQLREARRARAVLAIQCSVRHWQTHRWWAAVRAMRRGWAARRIQRAWRREGAATLAAAAPAVGRVGGHAGPTGQAAPPDSDNALLDAAVAANVKERTESEAICAHQHGKVREVLMKKGLQCPSDHDMVAVSGFNGAACDICNRGLHTGVARGWCEGCDFAVCLLCICHYGGSGTDASGGSAVT